MRRNLAGLALAMLVAASLPAQADLAQARDHFEHRRWQAARNAALPLARAGNAEAELILGDLYGLPGLLGQDMARAVLWWERAAHKAHPLAQLRLARALAQGTGVPRDPLRAAFWARLAATGTAPGAEALAQQLRDALDAEARATLDRLTLDHQLFFYPLSE